MLLTKPAWTMLLHGSLLAGKGVQGLLALPVAAFFASRQCSGVAIRAAMDWALQQAWAKQAVVSGFHSPLEQSMGKVLMAAGSPAALSPRRWSAAVSLFFGLDNEIKFSKNPFNFNRLQQGSLSLRACPGFFDSYHRTYLKAFRHKTA